MNKQILKLAIPNIISNISIPLLGLVDIALLGRLDSEIYLAAVALGTTIFNILYWSFGFLRMGTTGLTAQAFGASNFQEQQALLIRSIFLAIAIGLSLILFQKPIESIAFNLLEGDQSIHNVAKSYFLIRIYAAPATIALYSLQGWFIGMQNTKYPMLITLTSNILNIAFSALFIYYYKMNADGAALGTLIAQYFSLILGIFLLKNKYSTHLKSIPNTAKLLNKKELSIFFKINKDIFLRTLCLIAVFTFFTSKSAYYGSIALAGNTILLQFTYFFSYLIDGLAYAAEALTGKYLGANDHKNLTRSIKKLFAWGFVLSLSFSLIYFIAGNSIINLLTTNKLVIDYSQDFLIWVMLIPLISYPSYLWDGIYIGMTASKEMLTSMFFSSFIVFFPLYFLTTDYLDAHSLWLSFTAFLLARGLYQTILYQRSISKKQNMVSVK
ncbi:MATE family efflux transporter [Aureibacter tunicatorum]|uniref:MATE family multidrug resistance protein n=1 Tax=Aureibacter tunicatorum TaxID=866807 RepID=A0AAE3XPM3_9BACT|nr:MATE family efflux transporter [Aureibacter tunicatorum]MDR6239730.1 MATE family multidrug resistance protein [Aureibacter tunicatorum]BDD04206.1 MATE family efflux transporter [Aureibacter tunicatorum]